MQHSSKKLRYLASASVLALGLALGFGLAQFGPVEAEQQVAPASMEDSAATDLPDMVPQGLFVKASEQVMPAVVSIEAAHAVRGATRSRGTMPEFFRRFFEEEGAEIPDDHPDLEEFDELQRSQGSGVLISADGYIVTNGHVVSTYDVGQREVFEAEEVEVTLANDDVYEAEIVGVDLGTDIAVLKIDGRGLAHVRFADSDRAAVGEWVLALGAPFGLEKTVSAGIVSAKGRALGNFGPNAYQDYIQTDAAINRGNSGGPLVNLRGEIVGINTLIITEGREQQFAGVGFAVPSNLARTVSDQLIEHGRVIRGWLGVSIQPMTREFAEGMGLDWREVRGGVVVPDIHAGGPADRAGLKPYDVVVSMNGTPLESNQDFLSRIALTPPGETVELTVIHQDSADRTQRTETIEVTLAERADEIDVYADTLAGATGPRDRSDRNAEDESDRPELEITRKLGFTAVELTPQRAQRLDLEPGDGVVVSQVAPGSPAAEAGLQPGMVIRDVRGEPVSSVVELEDALAQIEPGSPAMMRVTAAGSTVFMAPRIPRD